MTIVSEQIAKATSQSEYSNLLESDKFGIVSVKTYGAVGDGVTNDTQAINDAISACISDGCYILFIPAGTYLIDKIEMTLPSGFELYGAGKGATVLKSTSTTESLILEGKTDGGDWIGFIKLHGLTIDGDNSATEAQFYPINSSIYDIEVTNHTSRNFFINTISTDINDSWFTVDSADSPTTALYIVGNAISVNNSYMNSDNTGNCVIISGANGVNFTETNNINFTQNTVENGGEAFIKFDDEMISVNILDNYFEGDSITIAGLNFDGGKYENVNISGNKITGTGLPYAILIDEVDKASSFEINSNNMLRGCKVNVSGYSTNGYNLVNMPALNLVNNKTVLAFVGSSKANILSINDIYFAQECKCYKNYTTAQGTGYFTMHLLGIYITTDLTSPVNLFELYINPAGGTTYAQGYYVKANARTRAKSGTSFNLEHVEIECIARNTGTFVIKNGASSHIYTESSSTLTVTFDKDTVNERILLTASSSAPVDQEWIIDLEIKRMTT